MYTFVILLFKPDRKKKVFFHTDAAQAIGKVPIDVNSMNIDLMSISGHKLYGPKGQFVALSLTLFYKFFAYPISIEFNFFIKRYRSFVRQKKTKGARGAVAERWWTRERNEKRYRARAVGRGIGRRL